MAKRVEFSIGRFYGTGRTKTEAMAECYAAASKGSVGSFEPAVVSWRTMTTVVYRDPVHGWSHAYMRGEDVSSTGHGGSPDDRDACIESARWHIASCELTRDEWFAIRTADDVSRFCPLPLSDDSAHEIALRCAWNRAYDHAKGEGMADGEAHQWACWNRNEFIEGTPKTENLTPREHCHAG